MERLDGISNERFRIYCINDTLRITYYSEFCIFGSVSYRIKKMCRQDKGEIKC